MKRNKLFIKTGQLKVSDHSNILVTLGLGSCVAVTLYDEVKKIGGMIHYILPVNPGSSKESKYADTGINKLIEDLTSYGAKRVRLKAKMVGGAIMFGDLLKDKENSIGRRNIDKGRSILKNQNIPLIREDIGGDYGRSVEFNLSDGKLYINSFIKGDKII